MKNVILVDTETTGLPRRTAGLITVQPRIVSITWLIGMTDGLALRRRTHIVRPEGFTIPAPATAIHGISTEYARARGSALSDVLHQLREDCLDLRPELAVAHNAGFDLPVIAAEFQRAALGNPLAPMRKICTMLTTTGLCRIPRRRGGGFKWPKLQELHLRLFNRSFEGAHGSGQDVAALYRCFCALCGSGFYNAEFELVQPTLAPQPTGAGHPNDGWIYDGPVGRGFVFACNAVTMGECLGKGLFGAPTSWVLSVPNGSPCFLYNYEGRSVHGAWRAIQAGRSLEPRAWGGLYPYQCRVESMTPRLVSVPRDELPSLPPGRFGCTLTREVTAKLLRVFGGRASAMN